MIKNKRWRKRRGKQNNGGFSLVELLVSVIILAIIAVPLMNSFISASRTNAKAKRVLEATTAGQNLVEQIKAESVDNFIAGATSAVLTDNAGNSILDADGNPYYSYEKTVALNVNGRAYEAVATISPKNYLGSKGVDASGNPIYNYNSVEIPQISNMNSETSAFLIMDKDDDLRAVQSMDIDAYTDDEQRDLYLASVSREIILTVTKDVSNVVHVKGTLSYQDANGNALSPYYEHELYTGEKLENVFICFTPMFYQSGGLTSQESIVIENADNVPLKLYLVKQKSSVEDGNPAYFAQNYCVNVRVEEGTKAPGEGASGHVITNLLTGASEVSSQIQLTYQSGYSTVQYGVGAWNTLKLNQDGVITEAKSTNLIYDIEVKVYRDGESTGGEALATLAGTKTK